jgi:hypothetical protein
MSIAHISGCNLGNFKCKFPRVGVQNLFACHSPSMHEIAFLVTPRPPRGRACYPWQLSRISRLAPQTNTSLFCALCPHSCAPEKDFPVGHPSSNRSSPSTLNLEFFSDELPEKKVYLVDMSILSILLSPGPGCHISGCILHSEQILFTLICRLARVAQSGKRPLRTCHQKLVPSVKYPTSITFFTFHNPTFFSGQLHCYLLPTIFPLLTCMSAW